MSREQTRCGTSASWVLCNGVKPRSTQKEEHALKPMRTRRPEQLLLSIPSLIMVRRNCQILRTGSSWYNSTSPNLGWSPVGVICSAPQQADSGMWDALDPIFVYHPLAHAFQNFASQDDLRTVKVSTTKCVGWYVAAKLQVEVPLGAQ